MLYKVFSISLMLFLCHWNPNIMNFQIAGVRQSFKSDSFIFIIKQNFFCCTLLAQKPIFHKLMLVPTDSQSPSYYNIGMVEELLIERTSNQSFCMGLEKLNRRSIWQWILGKWIYLIECLHQLLLVLFRGIIDKVF